MQVDLQVDKCSIGADFAAGPLLTSVQELDQKKRIDREVFLRVEGARVVYINYALLRHDFPQLQDDNMEARFTELKSLSGAVKQKAIEKKIEEWLISNTAFISESQAAQAEVNTPIAVGKEQVFAFRPPFYGRAAVFSVENNEKVLSPDAAAASALFENRLIDVKGIGVGSGIKPLGKLHYTGLITVGEILYELMMRELLERIFRHSNSALKTLPVYGIIDLGFNEVDNDGLIKSPAGLMVRRAHRRPYNSAGLYNYNTPGHLLQLDTELLLRRYGVTSTKGTEIKVWKEDGEFKIQYSGKLVTYFSKAEQEEILRVSHYKDEYGELIFDCINVQHTREIGLNPTSATLLDFGAYTISEKFTNPILSLANDKLLYWGGSVWPEYKSFVHPKPELALSNSLIGEITQSLGYFNGKGDKYPQLRLLCDGLADDFRAGKMTSDELKQNLQDYLNTIANHLSV